LLGWIALLCLPGCGGAAENARPSDVAKAPEGARSPADAMPAKTAPAAAPARTAAPAERPADPADGRPAAVEPKVKIKMEDGRTGFSIKWMHDGAKLVDAEEREMVRFNASGDKLKIKDDQDNVLGYLVGRGDRVKIEDPSQQQKLFQLVRQADGDWKLEDASDQLVCRVKVREYGMEIESPGKDSLYKIKQRDGKTSLRDASDVTKMYTKAPVSAVAFACFGLDALELPVRAGLFVQLSRK
jgi:hypothetical protein